MISCTFWRINFWLANLTGMPHVYTKKKNLNDWSTSTCSFRRWYPNWTRECAITRTTFPPGSERFYFRLLNTRYKSSIGLIDSFKILFVPEFKQSQFLDARIWRDGSSIFKLELDAPAAKRKRDTVTCPHTVLSRKKETLTINYRRAGTSNTIHEAAQAESTKGVELRKSTHKWSRSLRS